MVAAAAEPVSGNRGVRSRPPWDRASLPDSGRALFWMFWPFTAGMRRWMLVSASFLLLVPLVEAAEIWLFKRLVDDVLVPATSARSLRW